MWNGFKILLSAICLVVAALFTFIGMNRPEISGMLGVAGLFVFCAAAPWIDIKNPSRALGLAGIVIALGLLWLAISTATGNEVYPKHCSGNRALLCDLENFLYATGGPVAAAIPSFLTACLVFYGSCVAFARARAV